MGLLETARAIKAGKQKLSDVPEGTRKAVQRLIPVAGEAPKPLVRPALGVETRFRKARTV